MAAEKEEMENLKMEVQKLKEELKQAIKFKNKFTTAQQVIKTHEDEIKRLQEETETLKAKIKELEKENNFTKTLLSLKSEPAGNFFY